MAEQSKRRSLRLVQIWTRGHYPVPLVVADAAAVAVGFGLGGLGRIGIGNVDLAWTAIVVMGAVTAVAFVTTAFFFHLYRGRFLVASFDEVVAVGRSWLVAASGAFAINLLAFEPRVPLSVFGLGVLLSGAAMLTTRLVWRLTERSLSRPDAKGRTRVVVFGAGEGAELVVRSMLSDSRSQYVPVAVLDDDPLKTNRRIEGLHVVGSRRDIPRFTGDADALLIAIPSASAETVASLTALAEQASLEVMVLPSTTELIGSLVTHEAVRPLGLQDLLGRAEVELDEEGVRRSIQDRVVLVTGAGGSIGSELCRQLARYEPARLVMVDRDETALQQVQLSLTGDGLLLDDDLMLGDLRDRAGMMALFEQVRPAVVFHAAALKHLPMLEAQPREALLTNVHGTKNVLDAAAAVGVDCFVNVSTDKAADPISVLGSSKRLAEALTVETGLEHPGTYVSVRFGNVLGSRGSVLKVFEAQVDAGVPLRITDPEVTRFFKSVSEAARLIVQAGAIGKTGETLVLDMGEPVKILDLAHRFLKHRRSEVDLIFTGLRPNEKLHEVLRHSGEVMVAREHPRIWHTDAAVSPVKDQLHTLDDLNDDELRLRMLELIGDQGSEHQAVSSPDQRIYLSPPDMSAVERSRLINAFDGNWLASVGPELDEFEQRLAFWTGRSHAVAVSSGTAGLHLAMLAAGVGAGDEVFVSTMTFVATPNAVLMAGATPVFVDSSDADWNLDPDLLDEALADRARVGRLPKAVVAVDLYGQCADYVRLEAVCERYGVVLISDAAESLGALMVVRVARLVTLPWSLSTATRF